MPVYTLSYHLNGHPQSHQLQLQQPELTEHDAAMHLILLHFGDSENSLLLPDAQATPEVIVQQAELLGVSHIKVDSAPD
ncbi:hypothetical protein SJI00_08635 [Pseudomonas sp. RP23018S]|uniref:hypothetical protein n=1 Tax=Pseudomonas sp. RP23018S TaxID=3096037 RepID=UPI002ACACFC7|nr:hypothetical protein [Pseudomonas sp. RP23018S]MDZ5602839.1 hypothetical protein [Pseudomonas sp. RP23018S]